MPTYFTDSSALVKRYVRETGSAWVLGLFAPSPQGRVYVASITAVEVVAALTRRARSGTMTPEDAAEACATFLSDLPLDYQVVEVSEALIQDATVLVQRHKLRGYDAVQLAAGCQINALYVSLGLPTIIFVSGDNELNAAARNEGLTVDDPNAHP